MLGSVDIAGDAGPVVATDVPLGASAALSGIDVVARVAELGFVTVDSIVVSAAGNAVVGNAAIGEAVVGNVVGGDAMVGNGAGAGGFAVGATVDCAERRDVGGVVVTITTIVDVFAFDGSPIAIAEPPTDPMLPKAVVVFCERAARMVGVFVGVLTMVFFESLPAKSVPTATAFADRAIVVALAFVVAIVVVFPVVVLVVVEIDAASALGSRTTGRADTLRCTAVTAAQPIDVAAVAPTSHVAESTIRRMNRRCIPT